MKSSQMLKNAMDDYEEAVPNRQGSKIDTLVASDVYDIIKRPIRRAAGTDSARLMAAFEHERTEYEYNRNYQGMSSTLH